MSSTYKVNEDYYSSQEWISAEDALAAAVGFRVRHSPADGRTPGSVDAMHIEMLEFDTVKNKVVVRAVQPTTRAMHQLWRESVRLRIDRDSACKFSWEMYQAATGETIESFNGSPAGGPLAAVEAERRRLIEERDYFRRNYLATLLPTQED